MINIAILGFGTVGSGTAELILKNNCEIVKYTGEEVNIKYILDLREFPGHPLGNLIVHDFNIILNDPEITLVAEMMGGSHPAYDFSKACLSAGKSVVTSNKEVVANFGGELLRIAQEHNVYYKFEASVGGGIPVIRPMLTDLSSNRIYSINSILNGTTNYILTRMSAEGLGYADILSDAQKLRYAEANPAADVDGIDAARKIVILAAIAYGKMLPVSSVHTEGIRNITLDDFRRAGKLGCTIKLIANASVVNGKIQTSVAPRLVHSSCPLYGVNDVFNSILIDSDMLGEVMFYGKGAGKLPTASAVVSDIMDVVSSSGKHCINASWEDTDCAADFDGYICKRFITVTETDISSIEKFFGDSADRIISDEGNISIITKPISEHTARDIISSLPCRLVSVLRFF